MRRGGGRLGGGIEVAEVVTRVWIFSCIYINDALCMVPWCVFRGSKWKGSRVIELDTRYLGLDKVGFYDFIVCGSWMSHSAFRYSQCWTAYLECKTSDMDIGDTNVCICTLSRMSIQHTFFPRFRYTGTQLENFNPMTSIVRNIPTHDIDIIYQPF